MTIIRHTQTPWCIQSRSVSYAAGSKFVVRDGDDNNSCPVAEITTYTHPDKKDADFILRAVNAHDALVAALGTLLDQVDYTVHACSLTDMVGAVLPSDVVKQARAALALAKKEA